MDGKEDFFIGNAHNTPAKLYIQNTTGSFNSMSESIWESDKVYEDGDAVAIDIEGDGDMDLIVTSAGYQFEGKSGLLSDRIYLNDGTGNFKKSTARLPYGNASTKSITAGDIDGDGDDDLFVGGSVKPGKYPLSNNSFILRNDNGKFIDVSSTYLKDQNFGLVSDAEFKDLDGDNDLDLVVVGEWTGVQLLDNENNTFVRVASNLNELKGWWQELELDDIDGDGDVDVLVGNIGGNNKFKPSIEKPIYIYSKDFDSNGSYDVALTKMNNGKMVPVRGKECSSQQNPFLLDDIKSYKQFSNLEFKDIYGEERLAGSNKLKATIFESVYLENFGDFNFKMTPLNSIAQMGPTNSFIKITEGGDARFIGAGALYDTEVETIKYDGNYGYQLKLGQTKELNAQWEGSPVLDYDIRDLACITVNEKKMILLLCNNDILRGIEYEE